MGISSSFCLRARCGLRTLRRRRAPGFPALLPPPLPLPLPPLTSARLVAPSTTETLGMPTLGSACLLYSRLDRPPHRAAGALPRPRCDACRFACAARQQYSFDARLHRSVLAAGGGSRTRERGTHTGRAFWPAAAAAAARSSPHTRACCDRRLPPLAERSTLRVRRYTGEHRRPSRHLAQRPPRDELQCWEGKDCRCGRVAQRAPRPCTHHRRRLCARGSTSRRHLLPMPATGRKV
eukprot:scaffold5178_cov364-Prasinococcus_capsulatus_cf.AAC.10